MEDDATGYPRLDVLGDVRLVGARGQPPARSERQCLEYCGWLLRFPGQSAYAMSRSLLVAEGTRRSNVSRLRLWLGQDGEGELFLPEAYSGRVRLHPGVSSDWERVEVLLTGGVDKVATSVLIEVLGLVRGVPLQDVAPGAWGWAEGWRVEMCTVIRDVGVVLCGRALAQGDVDLARWGVSRALLVAPGDERLLGCRVRMEHVAGNRLEVERLVLSLTRRARGLGIDLAPDTVALLREVMDGPAAVAA